MLALFQMYINSLNFSFCTQGNMEKCICILWRQEVISDFNSNETKLETSPASDKYFKINRPELFVQKETENLAAEVSGLCSVFLC